MPVRTDDSVCHGNEENVDISGVLKLERQKKVVQDQVGRVNLFECEAIMMHGSKRSTSQHEHEASTNDGQDHDEAISTAKAKGHSLCIALGTALTRRGRGRTSTDDCSECVTASSGRSTRGRGRCHGANSGGIHAGGILGTAGVIIAASRLARRICGSASHDTVGGCLSAFVVWDGLGVLGGIRRLSVAANAIVAQGGLDNASVPSEKCSRV